MPANTSIDDVALISPGVGVNNISYIELQKRRITTQIEEKKKGGGKSKEERDGRKEY
jgi:hypothetical protein